MFFSTPFHSNQTIENQVFISFSFPNFSFSHFSPNQIIVLVMHHLLLVLYIRNGLCDPLIVDVALRTNTSSPDKWIETSSQIIDALIFLL